MDLDELKAFLTGVLLETCKRDPANVLTDEDIGTTAREVANTVFVAATNKPPTRMLTVDALYLAREILGAMGFGMMMRSAGA